MQLTSRMQRSCRSGRMRSVRHGYRPGSHWGVVLMCLLMTAEYTSSSAAVNSSSLHLTLSPTLATPTPTPTSIFITPSSVAKTTATTPTFTSTAVKPNPKPTVTPVPGAPLINYTDHCAFIYIGSIDIKYVPPHPDLPRINNTVLTTLGHKKDNLTCFPGKNATYQRFYGSQKEFVITLIFKENDSAGLTQWIISDFNHRNLSVPVNNTVIYSYGGFADSVFAPTGLYYRCDEVEFHGDAGTGSDIVPHLTIKDLRLAYIKSGDPLPKKYVLCGQDSPNNKKIDITVGLAVGITVVAAAICIVVGILLYSKFRKRDYDLLNE